MEGERPLKKFLEEYRLHLAQIEASEPIRSPEGDNRWRFKAAAPIAQDVTVITLSVRCPDRTERFFDIHLQPGDMELSREQFMKRYMEPAVHCLLN